MESTKLSLIPYPSDNDDPWFEGFQQTIDYVDNQIYGLLVTAGNIIIPPPNIVWNLSLSQLSWDDDFIVNILSSNFSFKIKYGPDGINRSMTLNDGDKVVITVPVSSASDVNGNFKIVSGKLQYATGIYVFGMRVGNKFYANLPTSF